MRMYVRLGLLFAGVLALAASVQFGLGRTHVAATTGSISGTVTAEATGAPLPNICVDVYDTSHNWVGSDYTDSSGAYSVGGLPTGYYKVKFGDHDYHCVPMETATPTAAPPTMTTASVTYAFEWYDDKADFDSADLVSVTAGSPTTGIDAALAVGGSISGTVTDTSGIPLSGIHVGVYDTSWDPGGSDHTDSSGYYGVGGLPTGDYKVWFWDNSQTHAFGWYDDKVYFDSADSVSVTAGSPTTGIDAALADAGWICGTVTDTSGSPLSGIYVNIHSTSHNWSISYRNIIDSSGNYSAGGLRALDYKVEFKDPSGTHVTEWYNDKTNSDSADLVSVTAGSCTSGINAALALELEEGGPISSVAVGTDVYAFGRDAGGSYWYRYWNGASWSAWTGLGGVLGTSPSAVAAGSDVYVFGLDVGGGLWYQRRSGGTWGGWQGLGGTFSGEVSAAATASNDVYVFGRDASGGYWYRRWNGSSWEAWSGLGGILSTSPSAVAAGADVYVFGLDAGGGLWYQRRSGGTWSGWQGLGGTFSGEVSAAATASNNLYVFGRDAGGGYWYRRWNGTSWEAWSGLGGVLSASPAAVAAGADVYVLGLDAGGGLWYNRRSGGTWGGWQGLGGVVTGTPSSTASGANDVYLFARGTDSGLWYRHRDAANFGSWTALGGVLAP